MSSYVDLADNASGADPSGFLSAGVAAVKLVGAVAKVAPHVKHAVDQFQHGGTSGGPNTLNRSVTIDGTHAPASLQADPEREARAYETVNYVLRTLGKRIEDAGLVSGLALNSALSAASTHIEVELFSVNANRLFQSLEKKLADEVFMNSVFTSIYLIGAITAELSSSLPNYKSTYPPLGPYIIQQIFRAAIGEDAFRENLTANLDAYKTLATTAGLLRPTDIGYSIFPNFPSLTPTRYSSKSFTDVRNHKSIFSKLIQHFDIHGFPQPLPGHDVGPINDWRFLSGDSNTRFYDVEKADKHMGEAMGRVLYWLITSAERMRPGMAVIAYYKQHIELVNWMGAKFGFRVLNSAKDLDLKGPHLRLDNKCRATVEAWVIIMPSQSAQLNRQQSIAQWNQSQLNQQQSNQAPASPISAHTSSPHLAQQRMSVASSISSADTGGPTATAQVTVNTDPARAMGMGSMIAHVGQATKKPNSYPRPAAVASPGPQSTVSSPGPGASTNVFQSFQSTIAASPASQSAASTPATPGMAELSTSATSPTARPSTIFTPPMSTSSSSPFTTSPSYFPATSAPSVAPNPAEPLVNKRASVVRRKAPPPPRKFTPAKALFDFAPEDEGGEELDFHEGDDIEIVEKSEALESDGWCKARVKGSTKVGLAPLEYLEEVVRTEVKPQPHRLGSQRPPGISDAGNNRSVSMPIATGPVAASFGLPPSGATASGVPVPDSQNVEASRGTRSLSGAGFAGNTFQPQLSNIHENPVAFQIKPVQSSQVMSPIPDASQPVPATQISHPGNVHRMSIGQHNQGPGAVQLRNPQQRPQKQPVIPSSQITAPQQGVQANREDRKPSTTQPAPLTQFNLAAQQSSSNPSNQAVVKTQPRLNAPKPANFNFAPSFALNLSPQHQNSLRQQSSTNHQGPPYTHHPNDGNTLGSLSGANNNADDSSNTYTNNSADPNTGIYPPSNLNSNYSNAPNPAYYGISGPPANAPYSNTNYQNPNYVYDPNNMNAGSTYINAPNYYSESNNGLGDGLLGVSLGAAADPVLDSALDNQDPASFVNSASDLASIDPFYAINNPGFSAGPGSPTSFQSASGDPLAAGGPDGSSPSAGLALGQSGAGLDADALAASPLAGLAIDDTSSASLQMSVADGMASGAFDEQSVAGEQTTGFGDEDEDAASGGAGDEEMAVTTDVDTTYSDMGDGSDGGFGYS